ncbi:S9 family peptidase [Novosphingopyxis sp. YJ-S2-01]|uniref:S9 family peptidase n=1 Tax=Novosphingopyxis sp. YJ-S2-01 TaxID=2794021 RepID=UPI0018DB0EB0|nr:DPP IV N-terminal domain-containing protein [Novosphingopyxis sp. YJ-S2-01]
MKRTAVLALLAATSLTVSIPATAQTTDTQPMPQVSVQQQPLTLERIFGSPSLSGPMPRGLKLAPDGSMVTLLKNREDEKERYDLWAIDLDTGESRMLVDSEKVGSGAALSEAEKMQRERARIGSLKGIVSYEWSPDAQSILVPLDGDLYLAGRDGEVRRLTDTPEGELNPTLSPGGGYLSFVRDGRLMVQPMDASTANAITPEEPADVEWGVAEFVAQEEMDRDTGQWWAPNDNRIAVARVDNRPVGVVTRAAIGADGTEVYDQRYPAAGTPNAIVDLYVMNPDGSDRVKVDMGANSDIYLARVNWAPDGKTLYVQRQNRPQTEIDLLKVDPATGASEVLFSEEQPRFTNLSSNFRALKDGSLLWSSERTGYNHLYRWKDGKWTQLTSGDWVVGSVIGLDEDKGLVWFTGNRETPLENHVYRTRLDGKGKVERLTEEGWWNGANMDGKARAMLVTRSSPTQPPQTYLADADGKRSFWISENKLDASHPYAPYLASHVVPEFGTLKAEDGSTLYYKMMSPKREPGKKYPVFVQHYNGPGAGRQVKRDWVSPLQEYLVDQGWIVFSIDGRGSPDRGKAFEDQLYKKMGTVEVEDQLTGARWLKEQPFVDPERVSIYGWSYGGYLTLKLLEAAPGFYAAGVSGAPVTDWTLYDTHYTERYMGMPSEGDNYERAGALANAEKIGDPLLLIHGMADDNVVFQNATQLAAKLQGSDTPFEMMFYPGQTHSVGGPKISPHVWHTILNFLDRRGVGPKEEGAAQ